MHTPVRVLFVCDGGTARSRMAATLLRATAGDRFEVHSAGIEEEALNPLAIDVMREMGIEIENTPTPALNNFEEIQFDYVISLCDQAKTVCLSFPRDAHNLYWTIADPTLPGGSQLEQLAAYRQARDTTEKQVQAWLETMDEAD